MRVRVLSLGFFGLLALLCCCPVWGQPANTADRVRNLSRILVETRPGTVEAAQILRERSEALYKLMDSDPALALSLALPPDRTEELKQSLPPDTDLVESSGEWRGPAIAVVEDDFGRGRSRIRWNIRLSGQLVELYFADRPPALSCERELQVRGIRLRGRLVAGWTAVVDAAAPDSCSTTGTQQTAVLLVRFPSTPLVPQVTASMLQSAFFGPAPSVDSYYREVSYGKMGLSGGVYGPFTLDADYNCETSLNAIAQAAIRAADGVVDFRVTSRIVIFMPLNGNCTGGTGTIGCQAWTSPAKGAFTASVSWIMANPCPTCSNNWLTEVSAFQTGAHEFGHNLGLQHSDYLSFGAIPLGPSGAAGEHGEYGDWFSIMGQDNGHIAAPHKLQLGWFDASNVQEVETPGRFLVQPLEIATGGLQALKVRRDTTTDSWLWLESRQPLGYYDSNWAGVMGHANWAQAYSGALVHYEDSFTRAMYPGHAHLIDFTPGSISEGGKLFDFQDAALQAGKAWSDPYSPLSLTINSASPSGLSVTVNYATPVLNVAKTHTGNFAQGQNGATYTVTVSNATGASPTSGTVTVSESVPAGMTLVSMAGTGWTCPAGRTTCTRSDSLNPGMSYPTITVTVNVASNAATPLSNSVSVSGGGSASGSVGNSTVINANPPVLRIGKGHTGNFTQGQNGAMYSVTVSNATGAGPTSGTATVTETVPAGLTLVSMAGTGWTCSTGGNTCARSDPLAAGASYPAVTVTVNVAPNAPSQVTNLVSVLGGGSATNASDLTNIMAPLPVVPSGSVVNGASFAPSQAVAPGSLVSIFGTNLASSTAQAGSIPLSTSLANVSVAFNGIPAPLVAVDHLSTYDQINAQLPWNVVPGGAQSGTAQVVVTRGGAASVATSFQVVASAPGIFSLAGTGTGQARAINNSDGTFAAPSGSVPGFTTHPAKIGDPNGIAIFATGLGAVSPPVANGGIPASGLSNAVTTPTVLAGNVPAQVIFAGMSPQYVGLNQINIVLAPGTPTGNAVPLQLQVGGIMSTNQLTIAVSQ